MKTTISPKKKIYATEPLIELEISYISKKGTIKENYIFDNLFDTELFVQEALKVFFKKEIKNFHISLYRKERYIDTKIDTENIRKQIEGAKTDRKKRIQQEIW